MRPVKLVLEGIRSYRNKTEIDFTDLSLFALIGDTGAGKSSIIEALCLALYGGTTWSGRNVTELMSDAAERMAVELTFTADGDTWTVTRSHRRAGGAPTHKLTSESGEKVDGADAVNKRIQAVLGLSKDQFLRAVVMPQGRFEQLLKATPGQRTDILKGIFRLQALDEVRAQVGTIAGRWREPIAGLQGERRGLPPDPSAALAAAVEAHRAAAARADALDAHTLVAEAAEAAAVDSKRRHDQIAQLVVRAAEELSGVSIDAIASVEAAAADIEQRALDVTTRQRNAASEAQAAERRAEAALGGFPDRDSAVAGGTRLHRAAEDLADLLTTQTSASSALATLNAANPPDTIDDELELAEKSTREAHALAQEAHRDAERALADTGAAYRVWSQRRALLVDADEGLRVAVRAADEAADGEHQAELAAGRARDVLASAQSARELAVRKNAAAAAAAGCGPGDDCPVCTQTLPPTFTAPAADDLAAADAGMAAATDELDRCQRALKHAASTHAKASGGQATASIAVDQAAADLGAAAIDLRAHLSRELDDALTEELAVAGAVESVAKAHAAARAAADKLEVAAAAASQARTDLSAVQSRWETECAQHRRALESATESISDARNELSHLPERWRPAPTADPPLIEALAAAVKTALDEQATHVQVAADHQAAADAAATELLELDTAKAMTVSHPTTELVTAAHRARTALAQLNEVLPGVGDVPEPPDRDSPLAEIAASVNALHAASDTIAKGATTEQDRLKADIGAQAAELQAALTAAEAPTLGSLRATAGGARSDTEHAERALSNVTTAVARATQIDGALQVASPFLSALDALNRLLADGKFIGHLVREREVALLTEASQVLRRLSGDRFGFGDGFRVIDRHSGHERAPDTLSGGERFQASLALALALVEIATRSGGQLEAVFIDEGFGSLDAGCLDQALSTLGAVASGGKLVALVSHLRQVAEYVDQVLLVERDDATGSHLRPLDPTERDTLLAEDARSRMTA